MIPTNRYKVNPAKAEISKRKKLKWREATGWLLLFLLYSTVNKMNSKIKLEML
jgi:hypothetical protein